MPTQRWPRALPCKAPRVEVFIGITMAALDSCRRGEGSGTTNFPIAHLALHEARAVAMKAKPPVQPTLSTSIIAGSRPAQRQG